MMTSEQVMRELTTFISLHPIRIEIGSELKNGYWHTNELYASYDQLRTVITVFAFITMQQLIPVQLTTFASCKLKIRAISFFTYLKNVYNIPTSFSSLYSIVIVVINIRKQVNF